jgi:adenosine deaminase
LMITVSTDDPKMFGNSLAEEYRMLETALGFTQEEVRAIMENAVNASWMEPESKLRLLTPQPVGFGGGEEK